MKSVVFLLAQIIPLALSWPRPVNAQSAYAATQRLQLSAFGTGNVTYTGLESVRNVGVTAGVDLGVHSYFHVYPALEVRGTAPFAGGFIQARNLLGGLRGEHPFGRFTPYANLLYGRGLIKYGSGLPNFDGTRLYVQNPSNILSLGGGVEVRLTDHFAVKVDGQLQRYSTPVVPSRHFYAKPVSLGVVYRFDFNHHAKQLRK